MSRAIYASAVLLSFAIGCTGPPVLGRPRVASPAAEPDAAESGLEAVLRSSESVRPYVDDPTFRFQLLSDVGALIAGEQIERPAVAED